MQDGYWFNALGKRLPRRGVLAASGTSTAALAFLAACGGGKSKSSGQASGMLTQPADTSKQARHGGTSKWFLGNENATLDIHVAGNALNVPRCMVYSDLFSGKPGYLGRPELTDFTPDLAESWEYSPDKLQVTFKIRQGAKWHNKPPVNNRLIDGDDLLYSWDRFVKQGRIRTTLANAANPTAPVLSWTMTDAHTLVMKLKEPTVDLFSSFSGAYAGQPSIIPKETDKSFDIRGDMIGSGPWVLSSYTPSSGMTFKRNPDYWEDRPFIDTIQAPFVQEYAQQLAQFKAGNIYTLGTSINQEDVISVKREIPDVKMYATQFGAVAPTDSVYFGWLPVDENKPLKDERVRQALSMSYDRDLYIDTFGNVSKFRDEGLPAKTYWNSVIGAGAGPWYLDPRTKDFGNNAKYYQHDVAEAKKMLAAAGYPNGVDVTTSWTGGTERGGPSYQRQKEVLQEMAKEVGFKPKVKLIDYAKEYGPTYRDGRGKFVGWAYVGSAPPGPDPVTFFYWRFHSLGQVFLGYDVNGKGDGTGDPYVDSQIQKARTEFDNPKRMDLVHDLQRYLAKAAYNIAEPGTADGFTLSWPIVANYQVQIQDKRGDNYNWWLDDSQPPLKKA